MLKRCSGIFALIDRVIQSLSPEAGEIISRITFQHGDVVALDFESYPAQVEVRFIWDEDDILSVHIDDQQWSENDPRTCSKYHERVNLDDAITISQIALSRIVKRARREE